MSYQLGDVAPLSVTVTDSAGNPANAGSVTLTVTLPDGTTDVTSGITPTSTGVYDHDYATIQAGRHGVRWVATGLNASAFTDSFTVEPADDGDFISIGELKEHMKKSGLATTDDAKLSGFISAACSKIVELIGQVAPVAVTDEIRVRRPADTIIPGTQPVIAVTSAVVAGNPATTVPAADPDNGVDGWTLDAGGVLRHTRYWPAGTIRIVYWAGRTPVPGHIRLAALELAGHLWKQSQLNNGGGRPPITGDDQVIVTGVAYALPLRVRELLGLGKLPTGDVLVG